MSNDSQASEVSPWQLRVNGQYEQAIKIYSDMYAADQRPSHLYNRGSIYVEIGDYARALEDFKLMRSVQDPNYRADGEYMYQGICYWYLDQPSQAVESWRAGLDAPYTDAAGGVRLPAILLYAALRLDNPALHKESVALLRKHARRKLGDWPGPIVPFLLGKIDQPQLLQHAQAARSEALAERWLCQANFYSAVRALQEDDRATFRQHSTRCAESRHGRLEHEFYLARWEVQRDFPFPAFD